MTVHVVAHTHWDREWYHSSVQFQARLVALVDALLNAPTDERAPFLLDGQSIVLSDYLDVRPERAPDVARALARGALEAGPWYVLGDNLIPSGEAIVRNLEAGRRALQRLGAQAPRVAYCPDTFGHPGALPMIARGFGCDVSIVWRGAGGASCPDVDASWWESADGSRVLMHHLPPDGYEFGSGMPGVAAAAATRWRATADVLRLRNETGVTLLTVGADHHAEPPRLSEAIELLAENALADGDIVRRSGLAAAARALWSAAVERERVAPLPIVRGELRDSYGYTWTLQGTFATRAHQKRVNARLERALLRDVEPWNALAWLHALPAARHVMPDASLSLAQLPALTAHAWEALLRTHPHDTLCGCSIDLVADAMSLQQRRVDALVRELRESALAVALRHDRVAARERDVAAAPLTVIRNRSARPRGGVAEVRLVETLGDVRIGPRSGHATTPDIPEAVRAPSLGACIVQAGAVSIEHARRESPQHYPDDDLVRVHRVLAWVPEAPANGLRVLDAATPAPDAPIPVTVLERDGRLELSNGRLTVIASADGVSILDGQRLLTNVLALETVTDVGDTYTSSRRGSAERLTLQRVRVGARGPLRASVQLFWRWRDGNERILVRTELVLDSAATHVRCDVRGLNARRNHRLQLIWRTDVHAAAVMADAAFGPVARKPIVAPAMGATSIAPFETPPATMPMHRWLTASDDARGVTLFADGLAEAEATDSRLAITLVRAVGELSRPDLPERPGHAGWPCTTPRAQCRGRFDARVGLLLHGAWSDAVLLHIEHVAESFLVPLVGESWRDLDGGPRIIAGPELHGEGLVASAVTVSDDGETLLLRTTNVMSASVQGSWALPPRGTYQYRAVRLDGTPLDASGAWSLPTSHIAFTAAPRALSTFEVRRSAFVD